jgi:LCP family protein required for cell wall assembly
MVEPPSKRAVDSIALQRLNQNVAATQPFAAPAAPPLSTAPQASPAGPTAIAAPLKRYRGLRFYLLAGLAATTLISGSALAYAITASLHDKLSAASLVVGAAKAAVVQDTPLAGQAQGRTNFLVYGMTKDGLRTDSIMLASYYYKQKKLVTLNIPRDLYVNDGYENAKFGEVYAYAKERQPHDNTYPDEFVASLVSKEYGIPINYWVELNMQGEVSLVDSIGGINIDVPDSFTDYEYPNWNYNGYVRPAPSFTAGEQHMDGNEALIYSRSRHSLDNNEGSDFARSKRQALVLSSIMTKVKAQGILGNLGQLSKYLSIVNQDVSTSMSTGEMITAAKLVKGINPQTDHLIANWNTGNGFLCDSVTKAGADIVLYGVTGNCTTEAGGGATSNLSVYGTDSTYRQQAITYVQNLLQAVSPPPVTPASSTATTGSTSGTATPSSAAASSTSQ